MSGLNYEIILKSQMCFTARFSRKVFLFFVEWSDVNYQRCKLDDFYLEKSSWMLIFFLIFWIIYMVNYVRYMSPINRNDKESPRIYIYIRVRTLHSQNVYIRKRNINPVSILDNRGSTPSLTKHEGDSASNPLVSYIFGWHD